MLETNVSLEFNKSDLDIWNRELQIILIPSDVLLVIFLIFGIVGNGLVLYVYHFRIHRDRSVRRFIFDLALVDFVASVTCSCSDLVMNLMPAKYYHTHLCKGTWVFNTFVTGLSVCLLMIISIQRYLKMCYPFGPFLTRRKQHILMLISLVFSVICAVPPGYIYGSVHFQNPNKNLTGYRCSILKDERAMRIAFTYGIFLLALEIIIVAALVIMYSRIGYALHRHFKRMSKYQSYDGGLDQPQIDQVSSVAHKEPKTKEEKAGKPLTEYHEIKSVNGNGSHDHERTQAELSESARNLVIAHPQTQPEVENRDLMVRFTIMFVLITVVFVICYATKGTIMVIEALDPYFWENYDDMSRAWITFVYYLYIFSYVINPIIFAIFDGKFKSELKKMCCCR